MNSAHDCRYRQALHDLLDADIKKYLERGGEIERVTDAPRQDRMSPSQDEANKAAWENRNDR